MPTSSDAVMNVDSATGREIIAKLTAHEGFVQKMADTIIEGLDATVMQFNGSEMAERPDFKTRLEVWKQAMAYAEGLPMQRILAQTLRRTEQGGDLSQQLKDSPAFCDYMEAEIRKAREGSRFSRAQMAEKAKAIEPPPAA